MFEDTITAYHGTVPKCVESIVNSGFENKHSGTHWLGQGIYFFCDRKLAERWVTRNDRALTPVVIEAEIQTSDRKVLNLMNYDERVLLKERFEYYKNLIDEKAKQEKVAIKVADKKEIRCILFDLIKEVEKYDIVIALFDVEGKRYYKDLFEELMISTAEIQICVSEFCKKGTIVIKKAS